MKKYSRGFDSGWFAVIESDGGFYINIISSITNKPYWTYGTKFPNRELAESVCKILVEEYNSGYSDGQGSTY